MADLILPDQTFILIIVSMAFIVIIFIVFQWKRVSESNNTVKLMQKEIELKKIAMVEKDLESKRLMENPIQLPKEQQENLSNIRRSTSEVMNNVGYMHNEVNERLARLEAQTELKKLEKMLNDIEDKEKQVFEKGKL